MCVFCWNFRSTTNTGKLQRRWELFWDSVLCHVQILPRQSVRVYFSSCSKERKQDCEVIISLIMSHFHQRCSQRFPMVFLNIFHWTWIWTLHPQYTTDCVRERVSSDMKYCRPKHSSMHRTRQRGRELIMKTLLSLKPMSPHMITGTLSRDSFAQQCEWVLKPWWGSTCMNYERHSMDEATLPSNLFLTWTSVSPRSVCEFLWGFGCQLHISSGLKQGLHSFFQNPPKTSNFHHSGTRGTWYSDKRNTNLFNRKERIHPPMEPDETTNLAFFNAEEKAFISNLANQGNPRSQKFTSLRPYVWCTETHLLHFVMRAGAHSWCKNIML